MYGSIVRTCVTNLPNFTFKETKSGADDDDDDDEAGGLWKRGAVRCLSSAAPTETPSNPSAAPVLIPL